MGGGRSPHHCLPAHLPTVSGRPRRHSDPASEFASHVRFNADAVRPLHRVDATQPNPCSGDPQTSCVAQYLRICSPPTHELETVRILKAIGRRVDLRALETQPPLPNQSSRGPVHEAVTTRIRNLGKSNEEPTKFYRRSNSGIRRTTSTTEMLSWSVFRADRTSARHPLCFMRPSLISTLVLLKSNVRRVVTMHEIEFKTKAKNATTGPLAVWKSGQISIRRARLPAERQNGSLPAPLWKLAQELANTNFSNVEGASSAPVVDRKNERNERRSSSTRRRLGRRLR